MSLTEVVIGGRDADELGFGRRCLPAGAEDFPVEDLKPFSLQGGKDILLIFEIKIDGADAQFSRASDLIDGC